jgi:hypothetical protein
VPDAIETEVMLATLESLRGITPASGYATRPRVEMGPGAKPPSPLTEPTLILHDAEGSISERIVHQPPMWEHQIRLAVECWIVAGNDDEGRIRALSNLIGDVRRRLLRQDRTLGGLVTAGLVEVNPAETDEEMFKPVGSARLDFMARVTVTEEEEV